MKRCLAVIAFAWPALAQEWLSVALSRHVLNNEGVIALAKAGFDETFIAERIVTSRTKLDASVEGMLTLKKAGLSEDLIRVVVWREAQGGESLVPVRTGAGAPPAAAPAAPPGAVPMLVRRTWWGYRVWAMQPDSAHAHPSARPLSVTPVAVLPAWWAPF